MGAHEPSSSTSARTPRTSARARGLAAIAGLLAAAAGVLAGEVCAGFLSPSLSPVSAVGGAVVDFAPPAAKDWAIQTFGTGDKAFLVTVIALAVAVLGAGAGVLELRRPGFGVGLAGAVGLVGLAAVVTRSLSSPAAWLCALAAGIVAMALVRWLVGRLRREAPALTAGTTAHDAAGPAAAGGPPPAAGLPAAGPSGWGSLGFPRRGFLRGLAGTAGAVALGGVLTAVVRGASLAATAARDALRLPKAADPAPPVPAGAEVGVVGITPLLTLNAEFYRIDTAFVVPSVDPSGWRLAVTGLVEQPITITWAELLAQPLVERYVTLTCVSNEVGGTLAGNARWLGWPVRELLARARPQAGADMVLSRSVDGFTAGTPLEALTDPGRDALLAVAMNGEPLPPEHGFPVRLVVPGLYGYVSATKWVTELKVTTFAADTAYWSTRGWSEKGPIKTASRIDVPRAGAKVSAGDVTVAGVAWAQHRGISRVEVSADDGAWEPARLGAGISRDTWYQWAVSVRLSAGHHRIAVRATDGDGQVQTANVAPPAPDGATGYDIIDVEAA
ncbi:molybdopterin-dependent oxidoreductase [Sinomonas cyclohexanicum]|uniref:molybdopterin-dependent oxidoreductase n=1 Tax=Sinomonas cyclohexanicum TaxID=322009 RepID=UPI001E28BA86|nr:molybdopterin-dependent oxidoreductase [Corynebacterium cyclohexanicum]